MARLLAFLLISMALPGLARALPPLGYPVREVRIRPVPPGGLLPAQHGNWWGFADTTSGWVITSSLVVGVLFPLAGQGLLAEDREEAETLLDRYQSHGTLLDDCWEAPPAPRFSEHQRRAAARDGQRSCLLLPDGRLRAVPHREVRTGQLALLTVSDVGLVETPYAREQPTSFVTRPLLAVPAAKGRTTCCGPAMATSCCPAATKASRTPLRTSRRNYTPTPTPPAGWWPTPPATPLTVELPLAPYSRSFLTPEGLAEVQVADHAGHHIFGPDTVVPYPLHQLRPLQ